VHKKAEQQIFVHPSLLLLFSDPGSGMGKNQDPGWVKIRIRDKHPGSATLNLFILLCFPRSYRSGMFIPYPDFYPSRIRITGPQGL
jgi:hypothetical protein